MNASSTIAIRAGSVIQRVSFAASGSSSPLRGHAGGWKKLRENGIACDLRDERLGGQPLAVSFGGSLRPDQEAAVAAMLPFDSVSGNISDRR